MPRRSTKKAAAKTAAKATPITTTELAKKDEKTLPPRMRKVSRRLRELEDEKERLEQMIHDLNARKQRRRQLQQMAAGAPQSSRLSPAPRPSAKQPKNQKKREESDFDDDYDYAENDVSVHQQSDVSSLASRAHPSSDDDEYGYAKSDDVSVMTENIYHYDVRGRRVTDDDYHMEDTETIAACYQQITGRGDDKNKNSAKSSKNNRRESEHEPRVMIEWKRGKTYKPDANLAFDAEIYNHPTDLSLVVADDKSFFDELSFSSGDDSQLAAAVTDMPMEIDVTSHGSDESVKSGLHSECSVSVAAAPFQKSAKSHSKSNNLKAKNNLQEPQNPSQFLYQRNQSLDMSDDSQHNMKNDSSRKNRRRRKEGEPPPLTTDMSLLDAQENGKPEDKPPMEISFSESPMRREESLGSELGGASAMAPPEKSSTKGKSSTANKSPDDKDDKNKRSKKKKDKSKPSPPQPPQPPKESPGPSELLVDIETEQNALAFSAKNQNTSSGGKGKNATTKIGSPKSATKYKRASTVPSPKKGASPKATTREVNMNSSCSTLGGMTGVDTEACVAAPRRASIHGGETTPSRKSKNNGKTTPAKPKRKTGGNGLKKGANQDLKRENSNSTCNSSLTSLPGVMDGNNTNALVIDGGAIVK